MDLALDSNGVMSRHQSLEVALEVFVKSGDLEELEQSADSSPPPPHHASPNQPVQQMVMILS